MGRKHFLTLVSLFVCATGLPGCSPPSPAPASPSAPPTVAEEVFDASLCDDSKDVSSGTLCALKPSALDSRTKDIYGTGSGGDQNLGFGYHVVGVPKNYDPGKGLWIHFTGTYGRPYHQGNRTFDSSMWLNEILKQGYTVIQIAYDNRWSVNTDTCQTPNPGANRNNCAGEVREEVLTGVDLSPYRTTDVYNSVDYRLKLLLTLLQSRAGVKLPSNLNPNSIDWSQVTVSGHSQGGNLAYYIAKNRGVKFTCMLGAPYDVPDSVNPGPVPIADWFTVGTTLTPVSKLGQFITKEDDSYTSFHAGALYLGMTYGQEAFEASLPPYRNESGVEINGHSAAVQDPALASFRALACFR